MLLAVDEKVPPIMDMKINVEGGGGWTIPRKLLGSNDVAGLE